ncbi:MAG: methyl-accepting chemotaxis protein [Pseudomonadota bacterium]
MSLLERAGLVRQEEEEGAEAVASDSGVGEQLPDDSGHAPVQAAPAQPLDTLAEPAAAGLTLEQIYATAQVPACSYPAERLLRLIAGLNAMDPALRRQTIQAIDAADESWTIDDPLRDAAAKVAAIEGHASALRAGLGQAEQQTQAHLGELRQRLDASVAEIRRQITDLEGLLAREITRGAQEAAALEGALQARKDSTSRELDGLQRAAGELQGLVAQFRSPAN